MYPSKDTLEIVLFPKSFLLLNLSLTVVQHIYSMASFLRINL